MLRTVRQWKPIFVIAIILFDTPVYATNSSLLDKLGLNSATFKAAKDLATRLRDKAQNLGKQTETWKTCQRYLGVHESTDFLDSLTQGMRDRLKIPEEYAYLKSLSIIGSLSISRGTGFLNENTLRLYYGLSEKPLPADYQPLTFEQLMYLPDSADKKTIEHDPLKVAQAIMAHELHMDASPASEHDRMQSLIDLRSEIRPDLRKNGELLTELLVQYYITLDELRFADDIVKANLAKYYTRYLEYVLMMTYPELEKKSAREGIYLSGNPPSTSLSERHEKFIQERTRYLKNRELFEKKLTQLEELKTKIETFGISNLLVFKPQNLATHDQMARTLSHLDKLPKELQPQQVLNIDDFR